MNKKTTKMFEKTLKEKLAKQGINKDWMEKHLVIEELNFEKEKNNG
tara:strand:+ start:207 stop:344 length:138 start_codon:yes stop_codon:yes gene_type:complete